MQFQYQCKNTVVFSKGELRGEIGFEESLLFKVFRGTFNGGVVKSFVHWDSLSRPHYTQTRTSGDHLLNDCQLNFFDSLLTWFFHKTGVKGSRVIINGIHVVIEFDSKSGRIEKPNLMFPFYDFSGFLKKDEKHHRVIPRRKQRQSKSVSPALRRI